MIWRSGIWVGQQFIVFEMSLGTNTKESVFLLGVTIFLSIFI